MPAGKAGELEIEMGEVKTKWGRPGAGQPHGKTHMKNLKSDYLTNVFRPTVARPIRPMPNNMVANDSGTVTAMVYPAIEIVMKKIKNPICFIFFFLLCWILQIYKSNKNAKNT